MAWLEARGTVLLGDRAVKVLNDLYTEAAWLGACVARAQVGDLRKAATLKVDWDGWKPGDIDAANLLVADLDSNGLRELQARSGFVMRSINETRMTELSNALSNAVGQGLSQSATAALIKDKIGGASRWANVVANTETRRAVTAATLDTYAVAGIGMKEWATAGNAVDECKDFEDDGPIPLDGMWGDVSGPPAHPNCLCVVMPVLGEATPVTPSEAETFPGDVEESPEEPLSEMLLINNTGVTLESKQHMTDLELMPRQWLEGLARQGGKIEIFDGTVTSHPDMFHLKGVTPRGWPEGSTWDDVPGAAPGKTALLGTGGGGHGAGSIALHETGHALDAAFGGLSQSQEFLKAYNQVSFSNPYYRQAGPAGPQEAFGEGVAQLLLGPQSEYVDLDFYSPEGKELLQTIKRLLDEAAGKDGV